MNKVSGFVGGGSNLKDDVINPHYGWFQYYNQGTDILFIGMKVIYKFYVPVESNNLTT